MRLTQTPKYSKQARTSNIKLSKIQIHEKVEIFIIANFTIIILRIDQIKLTDKHSTNCILILDSFFI